MPKDPTTKASAAASPPKKPPVVDTAEIFTPKPPPDLPPNVRVSSPAQAIANLRIPDVSDEALIAAFKDKPLYVLDRVNWSKPRNPYRSRLENLISRDPALKQILDYVLPVYPPAAPQAQPQPQPTTAAKKIPEYKIPLEEKPAPKTPLGPDNAKFIENWLNGIKPGFYEYLAAKAKADPAKFSAATDRRAFTYNLLTYFAMYRSQLGNILGEEMKNSILAAALGPLGDAWEKYYSWDMQRKVKWMKNPLNPNALYYWLNSLPTQKAFTVAFIPFKAAWGIFSRGSGPLFTKAVYQYTERNPYSLDYGKSKLKEDYFFTPMLKFSQGTLKLADNLDKTLNYINPEITNKHFNQVLNDLKQAKKQFLSSRIVGDELIRKNATIALSKARRNLKHELNRHDGTFLQSWFKPLKKNLSRRLRHVSRDPINGLLALLAGSIMDIVIGIGVNLIRAAVSKVANVIPGLNTLRAQAIEFFSSNRYLQTARMGGATLQSFGKALVSPTSLSSGYLGAGAGGWVANALGLPVLPGQIIGGGIGYGLGAFYRTSLNMAMNPTSLNWIYRYNELLLKATDINLSVAEQNYWRGELEKNFLRVDARIANFRPGPFSNFAKWLYENPYARLPVNGWVIGDIAAKIFGWNPWVGRIGFATADWIWQTRGAWGSAIARWFPTTRLGLWMGNKIISAQVWVLKNFIVKEVGMLGSLPQWGIRPFWQGLQKLWSKIQPYATNVFNPGFFMGMQFLGSVFMSMGLPWGVAHLVGGLAGAATWWGIHGIYSAIAGKGAMSLAKWSAAGWIGYFGGLIAQGLLSLLGVHGVWMQFLPLAGSLIATVGVALIPGLGGFLGSFFAGLSAYNVAWALGISSTAYAAGIAIAATVASIALVACLAIFSGFVIYSSFWVPLVEESQATPQSANFSINTACNKLPNNNYQCCSSFDITQPLLNLNNYLAHSFDLSASSLVVQLFDQETNEATVEKNTDAFRRLPGETQLALNYIPYPSPLGTADYTVATAVSFDIPYSSKIDSFLSVPYDQQTDIFTHIEQNPQLATILQPFVELLQKAAPDILEDKNPKYLYKEFEAQQKLFKGQKQYLDKLIGNIKAAAESANIDVIISELDKAKKINAPNPLDNPENTIVCAADNSRCLKFKANMQNYYNSWNNFLTKYSVDSYLNQAIAVKNLPETDPNRAKQLTALRESLAAFQGKLSETIDMFDQQIKLVEEIKNMIDKIYNNLSKEDANFVLGLNANNLAGLSDEDRVRLEKILRAIFGNEFSGNYFYIPRGTNYKVCLEAEFRGQLGQPQTVCSTISASQSFWGQSNFAKSCTTFTPGTNP